MPDQESDDFLVSDEDLERSEETGETPNAGEEITLGTCVAVGVVGVAQGMVAFGIVMALSPLINGLLYAVPTFSAEMNIMQWYWGGALVGALVFILAIGQFVLYTAASYSTDDGVIDEE